MLSSELNDNYTKKIIQNYKTDVRLWYAQQFLSRSLVPNTPLGAWCAYAPL